jgi:two-component system, chemotaxis family, protein-glutamate methylesterase/glutaminase
VADEGPVEVLVGVGASAGGVEALLALVAGLDEDLPAALFVVLHQAAAAPTVLAGLLARRCRLPVEDARDGAPVRLGRVVVARPDHHLLVRDGHVVLGRGPREDGHRPGVDPLFRSLAHEAGPGAVGVVLSGLLDDGAAGMLEIVRHGGSAVVQEPAEARHDSMPRAALARVPTAVVTPAHAVGAALREIVTSAPSAGVTPAGGLRSLLAGDARRRGPEESGSGRP